MVPHPVFNIGLSIHTAECSLLKAYFNFEYLLAVPSRSDRGLWNWLQKVRNWTAEPILGEEVLSFWQCVAFGNFRHVIKFLT